VTRNHQLIASLRALVAGCAAFRSLTDPARRIELTGASVESRALVLAALQDATRQRFAVIVPGDASIDDFTSALRLFHRDPNCVLAYPSPALSPYQDVTPSLGVTRDEIRALGSLVREESDTLIVPVRALFTRVPRAEAFAARIVHLAEGAELDMRELLERLVENGFVRTDLVGEAGEFAFRGGILDLFPPNTARPVRVELFGDTIETLRWFDVETQRSEEASGPLAALPMTQFPATRPLRQKVARQLSLDFMDPHFKRDVAEKIERLNENGTFPGIENYLPLVADSVSIIEVLREWTVAIVEPDQTTMAVAKFESLLRNEFEGAAEKGRAVYPPERLLTPGVDVLNFLGGARLAMSEVHIKPAAGVTEAPGRERPSRPAVSFPSLGVEMEELRLEAASPSSPLTWPPATTAAASRSFSPPPRAAARKSNVCSRNSTSPSPTIRRRRARSWPSPPARWPEASTSRSSGSPSTPSGISSSRLHRLALAAGSGRPRPSSPTSATSRRATSSSMSTTASAASSDCSASPSAPPSARSWRSSTPAAASC